MIQKDIVRLSQYFMTTQFKKILLDCYVLKHISRSHDSKIYDKIVRIFHDFMIQKDIIRLTEYFMTI